MYAIGSVVTLHVAPTGGAPMQRVDQVEAVSGRGVQGDRYFLDLGTYSNRAGTGRHLTLIESEALGALKTEYAIEIEPHQARRNIVTRGVALNHFVGREFTVGSVRLRGMRLCEPCAHLERLSVSGILRGLIHRGGLRADILTSGPIRIGDDIAMLKE